jgi:hypothetical protein
MACNHPQKRQRVVIEWYQERRKIRGSVNAVAGDNHRISVCDACAAVKWDSWNDFCYNQGCFQGVARVVAGRT